MVSTDTDSTHVVTAERERGIPAWLARSAIGIAMCLPLGERWGYCDHWLAWALYSPHSSRVELWVREEVTDRIPETLRHWLDEEPSATVEAEGSRWRRVRLDRPSLALLGAPIYPQARFQVGAALDWAERSGIEPACRIVVWSAADRWTGERQLEFQGEIVTARSWSDQYWLNARARPSIAR